jgi:hypothetical protein
MSFFVFDMYSSVSLLMRVFWSFDSVVVDDWLWGTIAALGFGALYLGGRFNGMSSYFA